MNRENLAPATWRKSSHSNASQNCVEVADGFSGVVPVRDSKTPHGPALVFSAADWSSFVAAVKRGDLAG